MARPGTARAQQLLKEVSRELNIDIQSLQSPAKYNSLAKARREFCVRGVAEGLTVGTLAETIKRDVKTVYYHAFPDYRARKRRQMAQYSSRNTQTVNVQ